MKTAPLREQLLALADDPAVSVRLAADQAAALAAIETSRGGARADRGVTLEFLRALHREFFLACRPVWGGMAVVWLLTITLNSSADLGGDSARLTPGQIALVLAWSRQRELEQLAVSVPPPARTAGTNRPSATA
jgi:hypothetical protein